MKQREIFIGDVLFIISTISPIYANSYIIRVYEKTPTGVYGGVLTDSLNIGDMFYFNSPVFLPFPEYLQDPINIHVFKITDLLNILFL